MAQKCFKMNLVNRAKWYKVVQKVYKIALKKYEVVQKRGAKTYRTKWLKLSSLKIS